MKKLLIVFICIALLLCGCQNKNTASPIEDFEYSFSSDGTEAFIEKYIGDDTHIVVPDKIDGTPVTALDMFVFNSTTVSVTLPDSVQYITWYSFAGCKNLKTLHIGNSIKTIGEEAFSNCKSLEAIDLPATLETIDYRAFINCSSLKAVKIPGTVKKISAEAFYLNTSLESLIIEDGVERICNASFGGCDKLTEVTIPASVTFMDYSAFDFCDNLTSVTFEGNAPDARTPFSEDNKNLTIYYSKGTTGWDAPIWKEYNLVEK